MKKFVRINENCFALRELNFDSSPRVGGMDAESPLSTGSDPEGQLQAAKEQLQNFISMLDQHGEEGVKILARDMVVMAKEILNGRKISTY